MNKLNIGCGEDIKKGWINLDQDNHDGVNIVHKIRNDNFLPFKENSFDVVLCSHVIEDLDNPIIVIKDMIRILKKGGLLIIRVPNHTCGWFNLNHRRAYSSHSLKQIKQNYDMPFKFESKYYLDKASSIKGKIYNFFAVNFWNLIPDNIINYTFLQFIFPFIYIEFTYIK